MTEFVCTYSPRERGCLCIDPLYLQVAIALSLQMVHTLVYEWISWAGLK